MAFVQLERLAEKEAFPGYHGRFVHTEYTTVAFWNIDPGAPLPEHSHPHEQVTAVMEGEFEMAVEGVPRTLGPGGVAVIAPGMRHSARALTRCRVVDVFYPVREDFR